MAHPQIRAVTKAGLGAAVLIGFVTILLFGNGIVRVAESSAQCMEDAGRVRECGRVGHSEFWFPIVIVTGLSFFVGAGCFMAGQRHPGER